MKPKIEDFTTLNAEKTIETIDILYRRISERFPESSLSKVCVTLGSIARKTNKRSKKIARPNYGLRLLVTLIILGSLGAIGYSVSTMQITISSLTLSELMQATEASINNLVLIGAAIFFLITIETRIKRSRSLTALHELRSIAHVIDMHQLTKDPSRLSTHAKNTESSPKETLTPFELIRYLDYCSEMLSLTGKIAALYAQYFDDNVVVSSVNDLETLTTSLSRKIWQKIMILHEVEGVSGNAELLK